MIFTVAIPTFNNVKTIQKAVDSVINQSYLEKYEILVVDNFSSDGTDKVLDSYGDKISRITNRNTVSMYENHNICLHKAKGDYIIFCHSDDVLLEDSLMKFYTILKNRIFPKKYVLWGRSMFRDFYNNWKNGGFFLNQIATGISALDVFQWGGLTPSGTCYSRQAFLEIGGFVIVNHKLAPSDIVSMWKLCIYNFEFEMSERIFFNRYEAGTASGDFYNEKNIIDSITDSILCLKDNISEQKFNMIISYFENNLFDNKLTLVFRNLNLMSKRIIRKRIFISIIKNPFLIISKSTWRVLFFPIIK